MDADDRMVQACIEPAARGFPRVGTKPLLAFIANETVQSR
jgi:hypothetical protein